MNIRYYIFILGLLIISGCEEKEDNPPRSSDEITVSSRFYGTTVYYVMGYSFEYGDQVSSIPEGDKVADIIPERIITPQSEVIGVLFSTPGQGDNGFYLNGEFANHEEAMEFYENYDQAVEGPFQSLSDTIRENQVYTFLTHKENYVKFIINDVRIINSETYSDYVEVDLEYFIQRDGSRNFQEQK